MQGLATGALAPSQTLVDHIQSCLTCRACESTCPAEVPYYDLLLKTRTALAQHSAISYNTPERWLNALLPYPRIRRALRYVQPYIPRLRPLWRWLHLNSLLALLPPTAVAPSAKPLSSITTKPRGKVFLLTDCLHDIRGQTALQETIFVLQEWGFEAVLPTLSYCCGAWFAHQGKAQQATQCLTNLIDHLPNPKDYVAFLSLTSGCGAYLKEQAMLQPFPLEDLYSFLWRTMPTPNTLSWQPIAKTVGLFYPCTHRQMGDLTATTTLLSLIPNFQCALLPTRLGCCGAGGATFLRYEAQGATLAKNIGDFASSQHLQQLITTNLGCAMHLQNQLPNHILQAPIHFIAQSLGFLSEKMHFSDKNH